jgi:serine/threonine-protein phosphatase 2B catalytic subunit
MLLAILSVCSEEELTDADADSIAEMPAELLLTAEEIQHWRQEIKNKILSVGKVQRMFQLL